MGIDKAPFRAAPKTAFAVEVNGEKIFSTENEIKTAPSPILFDELRQGEVYDARLEIKGWALPGFDDTEWRAAVAAPAPKGRFLPAVSNRSPNTSGEGPCASFRSKTGICTTSA